MDAAPIQAGRVSDSLMSRPERAAFLRSLPKWLRWKVAATNKPKKPPAEDRRASGDFKPK